MGENSQVMAVLCSDGPENGFRVELDAPVGESRVSGAGGVFSWDGTYDENGDARYRPAADL